MLQETQDTESANPTTAIEWEEMSLKWIRYIDMYKHSLDLLNAMLQGYKISIEAHFVYSI